MANKGFGYSGRTRVLLQLAFSGNLPELRYLPRYLTFCCTALILLPLKLFERLQMNRKVAAHTLSKDPVFILGHMRSGTTHLHNLLCQDPAFSFPSTFQTHAPEYYVFGKRFVAPLFKYLVPKKRPMDNMAVSVDLPQEEEFAICAMSRHSFFFHMLFPRKNDYFFKRYVLLDSLNEQELNNWKSTYQFILKKFSLNANNKQLILKNPVNTGRTRALNSMYPNAPFVFIHRNPYEVFLSTRNLYRKVMPLCQLQSITEEEVDRLIVKNYSAQMERYFEDRKHIPDHRLIEISYHDLEAKPMETLRSIYDQLGFSSYEAAAPHFNNYLDSQKDYQKNSFEPRAKDISLVNSTCPSIFEKLGYEMLDPMMDESATSF